MTGIFEGEALGLTTEETLIYSATRKEILAAIIVTNRTFGGLPVAVKVVRAGKETLIARGRVKGGSSADILEGRVTVKNGDKLYAHCPIADSLDVVVTTLKDGE